MTKVHSFVESLEFSHEYADASWWLDVYRTAFPRMRASVCVRKDGWAQRGGIDRVLTLDDGRQVTVDEKVRKQDWPDILLERWSDVEARKAGWVQKPLACEFIAYAFVPSATCYLFPTLTLQRAWRQRGHTWCARYREVLAHNAENGRTWKTASVAVPIPVLLGAIADAMAVKWRSGQED